MQRNETFVNPYSTRPDKLIPGNRIGLMVVAVVGDVGDWAAYALPIVENPTPEYVATNGDKIDQVAAEKLFPVCRNLRWRN